MSRETLNQSMMESPDGGVAGGCAMVCVAGLVIVGIRLAVIYIGGLFGAETMLAADITAVVLAGWVGNAGAYIFMEDSHRIAERRAKTRREEGLKPKWDVAVELWYYRVALYGAWLPGWTLLCAMVPMAAVLAAVCSLLFAVFYVPLWIVALVCKLCGMPVSGWYGL